MNPTLRRTLKRIIPPRLRPPLRRLWRHRRTVVPAGGAGVVILAAGIAAVASGSVGAIVAVTALVLMTAGFGVTLLWIRRSHRRLRHDLATLETTVTSLVISLAAGENPADFRLPTALIRTAVATLVERGDALEAYALASSHDLGAIPVTTRRRLWQELHRRGYLRRATEVAESYPATSDDEHHRRRRLAGEIAVLSGEFVPVVRAEADGYVPRPGRVLHVVGTALPHTQSGYTLRTHYTAVAQLAAGLQPHVVTHMGYAHDGDDYVQTEIDGVTYHRVPGPARGSVPLDVWLGTHVQRVANVVRKVRPAVLHAASDYLNALTAEAIGKQYGIPVVYESRGFWEETWLSRQAQTFGWDLTELEATHGLPDVYLWRRDIEDRCRRNADRVVTLADVMADRIEAGGVPRDRITVIPNGVDVDAFPVQTRNRTLATQLGITDDTTVIGYISSIVEYEGIDTLISAFATVRKTSPTPTALLIVGDGPERERLMRQAADLGLDNAIFTGRVPHDQVLDYYSLIDIFVVPRKPVEVCHLVTPLKPFEAFATARTVVLSNVRALASIAHQSQAAELFEAGNPDSLATTLTHLLTNPDRRHHLAQTGATWVRTHRTWTANATSYLTLYNDMGAITPDDIARSWTADRFGIVEVGLPEFTADEIDIDALRSFFASREPIPYETLGREDPLGGAERILAEGWEPRTGAGRDKLDPPIDWHKWVDTNRSWNYFLHAWDFTGRALSEYARSGDRRFLDWCLERVVAWASIFNDGDARGTMAWYDMAIAHRAHRLAYLVEQAILHQAPESQVRVLLDCVARHQQEMIATTSFKSHNNHGVYMALGQLALARRLSPLPGMDAVAQQGRDRLLAMLDAQFADDGGHLEHSPEYHQMVTDSLAVAVRHGLYTDPEFRERVARSQEVLGWFVQPNGELPQVGDSQAKNMRKQVCELSPTADFHLSRGVRGTPETASLRVLPSSGYAIVRYPQPQGTEDHETAGYLLFAAGFHSRTHKHADDLTFTWFDRGREILIDSGRFGYIGLLPKDSPQRLQGYFYGSPERQYVESTRAHNTIEADGTDHVRRDRAPYGSAIVDAQEIDGHFRLRGAVNHGTWQHQREIIYRPHHWLLVTDVVTSLDDQPHDFRAWWNLPLELPPVGVDGAPAFRVELAGPDDALWVVELNGATPIAPVSGGRDPLRGWRSRYDTEFEPAWSFGFLAEQRREYTFRTLFSFGRSQPTGVVEHPFDSEE